MQKLLLHPEPSVAQTTTVDLAVDALTKLGNTVDAVAISLHNLGITGQPGCTNRCVIAEFLASLPGVTGVEVAGTRAWIQTCDDREVYDTVAIAVPAPVTALIRDFDHLVYPQLIAPITRSTRGGEQ